MSTNITDPADKKLYDRLQKEGRKMLNEASELERKHERIIDSKHIGKYYKTKNNFGGATRPSDYWFLYAKVTGLADYSSFATFQFQCMKNGKIEIEPKNEMVRNYLLEGSWVEIKQAEFLKAWHKVTGHINAMGLES